MTASTLRVAMLVTDANERSSFTRCDPTRPSPVLHPAEENLLHGLRELDKIEVDVIYAKASPLAPDFRKDGNCTFIPVPYRPIGVFGIQSFYLGRLLALRRHLRTSRHDLIHAQGTERECGLAAAVCTGPTLITLHGNLSQIAATIGARPFSYFWTAGRLEAHAIKRVSGIHCISSHTQRCVEAATGKTWVIPNAVSPTWFQLLREPSPNPFVTCVADITEWKNPILLARASDLLHDAMPKAEVHFYGACHEQHPYGNAFLEAIRTRPWCVFHGKSTTAVLEQALSRATCAVLPSKQENFGLALAEAMAAGVPVLGSDIGGIPDLIQDSTTGLLFDPDDPEALGRLLVSLHLDPTQMSRLAGSGRNEALRRFTIKAVAESHMKMYQEVAALKS